MDTIRIGPLELIAVLLLAIVVGVATSAGQSTLVISIVAGTAFMIAAFISTRLCLYFLVFSMLLGPEMEFGGEYVATGTAAKKGAGLGHGMALRLDDFLLVIVGLIWLVKAAINKAEAPVKYTPLNVPIMFYTFACALATLMGVLAGRVKPTPGFFFNLKYFEYFFLYFMVVNVVATRKQAKALVTASLVTCFLVTLFAIGQIPSGERVSAPFEGKEGEPNTLGGYLVFMLCIVGGLLLTPGAVTKRWPLIVLLVTGVFALLATLSRASFLAAAIVILILIAKMSYRRPLLFSVILMVLVASPWWVPNAVKDRIFFTFTQSPKEVGQIRVGNVRVDTSTSERLKAWNMSIDTFKASPIFGMGVTGTRYFMDAMYPRVLSETGLVGMAAFLFLLWRVFRVGLDYHADAQEGEDPFREGIALGFLLGLVALLVHAVGSNTFIIVRIMEPFWLFAAVMIRMHMFAQEPQTEESTAAGTLSQELPAVKVGLGWSRETRGA